jgi:hypothetical protein
VCHERLGAIIRLMADISGGNEKRRGLSLASKLFAIRFEAVKSDWAIP